jgi:hypothetical protein
MPMTETEVGSPFSTMAPAAAGADGSVRSMKPTTPAGLSV